MRKVVGSSISPFVRKVLLALELKGLEYEQDPVTPLNLPEGFRRYSPLGKIPGFIDDDLEICDSSVICQYLEDRYPDPALYPRDPVLAAKARWLEEFADFKLLEVLGPPLFYERIVKKFFLKQEVDEARVAANIATGIPPVLDYLESATPAEGWLVGDTLTIADLSVPSFFVNARMADYEVDASRWPRLASYLARAWAQPIWARRLATDAAMLRSRLATAT